MKQHMDEWLDLPDLIDRVHDYLEMGLYDAAVKLLEHYQEMYPGEVEMLQLFGRVHSETGEPRKALPYLKKALKLEKANIETLLSLFFVYTQLDQLAKARAFLVRAEKIDPEHELVISSYIWYYNETSQYETALIYFKKAEDFHIDNPEVYHNAGIAFQRLGHLNRSKLCFKTALELNPSFDESRDFLADVHIMQGHPEKSIDLYRMHLQTSPKNIRSLSRLVFCLCQSERMDEAGEAARNIIELYPNSAVGYVDLAYVQTNENQHDAALESIKRALDVSPYDAEALRLKGIIHSEKGNELVAEDSFKSALSADRDNAEIMRDYYHHLRSVKKYGEMEKLVRQVIKQEYPYCNEDLWFLADYHREQGRNKRAFQFLRKAYQLMPSDIDLLPPMIDILLDEGHSAYIAPFFLRYIEKTGWNEVMQDFARHKRLRGKWAQEGLRMFRYFGQNPAEYRTFVFASYVKKYLLFFSPVILGGVALIGFVFSHLAGIPVLLCILAGALAGWLAGSYIRFNRRNAATRRSSIPPQQPKRT
ncbi:MAG: tetratricopeptide repeat protein [Chitinivibrionales bacterium]|nr:tetratricopeptide repeat protein [Chitinivibrionales bacterium]